MLNNTFYSLWLLTHRWNFCQKKNHPKQGFDLRSSRSHSKAFGRPFSQMLNKQNAKCNWVLFDSIRFWIAVCTFNLCPEQKRTTIIMKCSSVVRTKELIFLNSKTKRNQLNLVSFGWFLPSVNHLKKFDIFFLTRRFFHFLLLLLFPGPVLWSQLIGDSGYVKRDLEV